MLNAWSKCKINLGETSEKTLNSINLNVNGYSEDNRENRAVRKKKI